MAKKKKDDEGEEPLYWIEEIDVEIQQTDFRDSEQVVNLTNKMMQRAAHQAVRSDKNYISSMKGFQDLVENNLRIQVFITTEKIIEELIAKVDTLEKEVNLYQPQIEDLKRQLSHYQAKEVKEIEVKELEGGETEVIEDWQPVKKGESTVN